MLNVIASGKKPDNSKVEMMGLEVILIAKFFLFSMVNLLWQWLEIGFYRLHVKVYAETTHRKTTNGCHQGYVQWCEIISKN